MQISHPTVVTMILVLLSASTESNSLRGDSHGTTIDRNNRNLEDVELSHANDNGSEAAVTWKKYDATDCKGAHTRIDGSKYFGGSQRKWQTEYTVDEMLAECKSKCANNEACVAFNFRDNREHPDYTFGGSYCKFWSTITDTPNAVGNSKDCWVSSKTNFGQTPNPTNSPSSSSSSSLSTNPTSEPTVAPTLNPTTQQLTSCEERVTDLEARLADLEARLASTTSPSTSPTNWPNTKSPTKSPTYAPTTSPTTSPTKSPTTPTYAPTTKTCPRGSYLYNGECIEECPQGSYLSINGDECIDDERATSPITYGGLYYLQVVVGDPKIKQWLTHSRAARQGGKYPRREPKNGSGEYVWTEAGAYDRDANPHYGPYAYDTGSFQWIIRSQPILENIDNDGNVVNPGPEDTCVKYGDRIYLQGTTVRNHWLFGGYNNGWVGMTTNSASEGARWIVRSNQRRGNDNRLGDCVRRKDQIYLENNRPNAAGVSNFLDGARGHNNVRVEQKTGGVVRFEIRSTLDSLGRTTNHGG